MSKNIVMCFDGTWKAAGAGDDGSGETNVSKLYALVKGDVGDNTIKYYDAGVGTNWYNRITGGLFGRGLSRNVEEGYEWLSKIYNAGDKVYLFGFSRGAYTARSLAGMLYSCGLVKKFSGRTFCDEAWEVYKEGDHTEKMLFKENNHKCPVEVVGVWDTVGSLGVPVGFLKTFTANLVQFHDTTLNPEIARAYHALAMDEERKTFTPTLWEKFGSSQVLEQVWFAGVHSDVGGGYPETALSHKALLWMLSKVPELKINAVYLDMLSREASEYPPSPHNSYKFYFGDRESRVISTQNPKIHKSAMDKIKGVGYIPRVRRIPMSDWTVVS